MNPRFRSHRGFTLSAAQPGGPDTALLTEGIFDSNLDLTSPGMVRVALWREWQAMLDDLRRVGPVWSIVRNGRSVLAVLGDYPRLIFSSDQQAAQGGSGDVSLHCHFAAWQQAAAFDSNRRCCGRIYGIEIEDDAGQIFHRVCLAKGTALPPFVEWTQIHQATGLEEHDDVMALEKQALSIPPLARKPGTLDAPLSCLRTILINAAQREISLVAGVTSPGASQTAQLDVLRASESQGWLVLSGNYRSLYVEAEPTDGTLLLEPAMAEGESLWRLSLLDPDGRRQLQLQPALDDRAAWTRLIREFVLRSPA